MIYNIRWVETLRGERLKPAKEEDKLLIEVQNLTRRYGKKTAVDGVSFKIRNGHIYGLVGADGAGKSTILNLMAGSLSPTEGTVLINGYDIRRRPMEAKRQIGYLPEGAPLFSDMTPEEYLTFVAETKGVRDEQLDRRVKDALTVADLQGVKNTLIRNLPTGVRRRVGIAQTLLGKPDIILLDEPTAGLDPLQCKAVFALIRAIGGNYTVVISGASMADLGGLCDHVITLEAGRVVADEDVEPTAAAEIPYEDETLEDETSADEPLADEAFAEEMPAPESDADDEEVTD